MKIYLTKDWGKLKQGDTPDLTSVEAMEVLDKGFGITLQAKEAQDALAAVEAKAKDSRINSIKTKVADAKKRGAIAPADTAVEAKEIGRAHV